MSESIATVLTPKSFEENSGEYYATLFRTVFRLTGDQEEAEDSQYRGGRWAFT